MPGRRKKVVAAVAALVVTAVVIAKRNPIRRITRRVRRFAAAPDRTRMPGPESESGEQSDFNADELQQDSEAVDLHPDVQPNEAHSAGLTAAPTTGTDTDGPDIPPLLESVPSIEKETCTDEAFPLLPGLVPTIEKESCTDEATPDTQGGGTAQLEVQKSPVATEHELEQAAWAKQHTTFNCEEESDYTRGPIRIVDAFDGIENVSSLLLNLDLSAKIQAVILSRRDLEAAKIEATIGRHQWMQLQSEVSYRISSMKLKLLIADDQSEMEPDEVEHLEVSEEELKKLEAFNSKITRVFDDIEFQVQGYHDKLLCNHAEVETYLEEAFVAARLLHPEPVPDDTGFDYHDFDVVYQGFVENEYVEQAVPDDDDRVSQDQESDQASVRESRREALMTWHQARLKLQKAQEAFDAREEDAHQDKCRAEEAKEDLLDWSLHWVQRGRELTRALIEAEEEDDKAREAAEEAGVDVAQHYQKSRFQDHASDGYGSGYERGGIAQAPRERIFEWMSHIPDGEAGDPNKQELLPQPEIDDWTYEDIAVNGSRSVIDDGLGREKIDSWSRACDRGGV
ncbi:hypothetical protein CKM354_000417500 [Cercospora kikuchii]|uniref:Uncharacterized protein n=1 Tax=Cercospora kikuchii TaxID=84275 RepID=A0A9P3CDM3_9PEZI|nr:uncharacterized protein CKM354_000417500 [Cercospora kikuchii]GIZ40853.1 hypothetical protein CKM354_000417500 [Cercospora kikuchii]